MVKKQEYLVFRNDNEARRIILGRQFNKEEREQGIETVIERLHEKEGILSRFWNGTLHGIEETTTKKLEQELRKFMTSYLSKKHRLPEENLAIRSCYEEAFSLLNHGFWYEGKNLSTKQILKAGFSKAEFYFDSIHEKEPIATITGRLTRHPNNCRLLDKARTAEGKEAVRELEKELSGLLYKPRLLEPLDDLY